jgi:DNA (cytosine-5)-methyltransferase 1
MRSPRLLDLFCGAGGASRGYQLAGFHVTGIDIAPQPRYCGNAFIQDDALAYVERHSDEYDLIHASPPCQGYSRLASLPHIDATKYPLMIDATRAALIASGKPWVIENIVEAPLLNAIMLCGQMFDLNTFRHRNFESNILLLAPSHRTHRTRSYPGWRDGRLGRYQNDASRPITVAGNNYNLHVGRAALRIDWMERAELNQAIPPAYTKFIGDQLMPYVIADRVSASSRPPVQ